MGLVYVTILSIVPVIAISFSILKSFGYHRQLQPALYQILAPLGDKGIELTDQVISFVDNVQGDVLAGVGLILLFITSVSMAQKVEDSFNHVWRVDKARAFARRISEYLTLILVGPVVMVTAMTMLARLKSNALMQRVSDLQGVGETLSVAGQAAPFALVVLAFTLIYWFLPNTQVRLRSALVGGICGGLLWTSCGSLFTIFVVESARTATIYATFAIVIVALVWLYLCWLILLVGALVSFYFQNPEHLRLGFRQPSFGTRVREQIALGVMTRAAAAFRIGESPPTLAQMAESAGLPSLMLLPVIQRLEAADILSRDNDNKLLPRRDPSTIRLSDVVAAIREPQHIDIYPAGHWPPEVINTSKTIDALLTQAFGDQSIYDLLDHEDVADSD